MHAPVGFRGETRAAIVCRSLTTQQRSNVRLRVAPKAYSRPPKVPLASLAPLLAAAEAYVIAPSKARRLLPGESPGRVRARKTT